MAERPHLPDPGKTSIQGVYDALRGGHRNLGADHAAAAELERAFPGTGERMLVERAFTGRVVAWGARRGIRQFVVGAGMPASTGLNLHEVARAVRPDSVTVYACGDLYAAAWSRALLAKGDPLVAVAEASVRSSDGVLDDPVMKELIHFAEPACVVAPMVLHFSPPDEARRIVSGIAGRLATDSEVAVSVWTGGDQAWAEEWSRWFGHQVWRHDPADVARWMTAAGLRIVPEPSGPRAGVVEARLWPHQVWAADELPKRPGGRIVVAVGARE